VAAIAVFASVAGAVPPVAFNVYGTVTIDGSSVAAGTVVAARCGGVQYAWTGATLYAGQSWYLLDVPGDDTSTPGTKEGCAAGETVSFTVEGLPPDQAAAWSSGVSMQQNLSARRPTPTPTPTRTPTSTPTSTPTPSPTPSSFIHVGDLDGSVQFLSGNNWRASVVITVHASNHEPLSAVTVSGGWSGSATGPAECTTGAAGQCSVVSGTMTQGNTATFAVAALARPSYTYLPSANHDPDGDSNGTTITVDRNPTPTPTASSTASPSATATPTAPPTSTPTGTATATGSPTATGTETAVASPTVTGTPGARAYLPLTLR
jgi:hypothetical protein